MNTPVDVCRIVFMEVENKGLLPDPSGAFQALWDEVAQQLPQDQADRLWVAVMTTLRDAQVHAFRLGWQMRGQI